MAIEKGMVHTTQKELKLETQVCLTILEFKEFTNKKRPFKKEKKE